MAGTKKNFLVSPKRGEKGERMFISKMVLAHKVANEVRKAKANYLADGFEGLAYRPKTIFFGDGNVDVAIKVADFLKADFIVSMDKNKLGIWTNGITIWVDNETKVIVA